LFVSIDCPLTTPVSPPREPLQNLSSLQDSGFESSSNPPPCIDLVIEPCFRESEEGEYSLNAILDSLIPFIRDSSAVIKLPSNLGKLLHSNADLEATTSKHLPGVQGKEFSWSRGIGVEHSPIKTRSSQKKLAQGVSVTDESVPSSTYSGALRAMKALTRAE
jgi:hypothetical protein